MLIDLHAHSSGISKCCRIPIERVIKEAKRVGLDGIVLTNHYQKNYVTDGDYAAFIRRYAGKDYPQGDFLSPDGSVLGRHEGIVHYTMGQRRGLGVSSNQGRLYVTRIDPERNTVTLAGNDALFSTTLTARNINLIPFDTISAPLRLRSKVRYRMAEQPCTVEQTGPDELRITFDQPQRAITPGQSVVLYDGEYVVGGGVIC